MTQNHYGQPNEQILLSHHEGLVRADQLHDLIPAHILQQIAELPIMAFRVDSEASDTGIFCERYGYLPENCANTLILKFKRKGNEGYAAAVCTGAQRLDINGAVRKLLSASRITLSPQDKTEALTSMVSGGITLFGLPGDWPVLIDNAVLQYPQLIMGGGTRGVKLWVPSGILAEWPGALIGNLSRAD